MYNIAVVYAGKTPDLSHNLTESTENKNASKINSKSNNLTDIQKIHVMENADDASSSYQHQPETESKQILKESNKQAKASHKKSNKRCKNPSPEFDTVPESQLSQEPQFVETPVEDSQKQENLTKPNKTTRKQSAQAQESKRSKSCNEKGDPYRFTDTESVASLRCKQNRSQKDPYQFTDTDSVLSHGGKQNKGKKVAGSKAAIGRPKTRGSQLSTQAFSPELGQESPYLSQNDFRSPIELSLSKNIKQGTTRGKGKKNTEKNKKSKTASRGKRSKKDDAPQDDSLSDVEVMRDASSSRSSVKDKFGAVLSDDEDICKGDEIYKLSGNIATKLNQKKAELEKFLNNGSERKLKRDGEKNAADAEKSSSLEANTDKQHAKKNFKSVNQKKQSAVSDVTKKPPPFDPALLKFPTRTGPIPTPEDLEEEMKKMKKQNKPDHPQKKPFQWDEDDVTEDDCKKKLTKEQVKTKLNNKGSTNSSSGYLNEDGQSDLEDTGHFDDESDKEDTTYQMKDKNFSKSSYQSKATEKTKRKLKKTQDVDYVDSELEDMAENDQCKATQKTEIKQKKKTKSLGYTDSEIEDMAENDQRKPTKKTERKQKRKNKEINHTYSELEDISGHEEVSDEEYRSDKPTHKLHPGKQSQRRRKSSPGNNMRNSEEDMDDEQDSQTDVCADYGVQKKTDINDKKRIQTTSQNSSRRSSYTTEVAQRLMAEIDQDSPGKPTHKSQSVKRSQSGKKNSLNKDDWSDTEEDLDEEQDSQTDMCGDSRALKTGNNKQQNTSQNSSRRSSYTTKIAQRLMAELDPDSDYQPKEEVKAKKTTQTKPKQQQPSKKISKDLKRKRADEEIEQYEDTDDSIKSQKKKVRVDQPKQQPMKKSRRLTSTEYSDVSDEEYLQGDQHSDEEIPVKSTRTKKQRSSNKQPGPTESNTQPEKLSNSKKQKNQSRMYGSQIMDAESDETAEEQVPGGDDDQEFDRETVTSVESFHNLCKVRYKAEQLVFKVLDL